MAATLVACVAMNAHGVLPAVAQRLAKLEATFLGIVRLLKARRPDLAPELDEMEKGCLATKEAGATGRRGARSKRERQIRGRWENRDGAWVLMRETRTLAVVHRDSGGWRATFLPGLRAFSDAAAARKAVAQYLKVRPAPPETE